jgi:hypothetical protein
MGLFSRKQRVRLDVFCGEFYDKNILTSVIAGMDVGAAYFETVKRSIAEVDGRFAAVDPKRFFSEVTLIRFEVFGLAWLHQLGDKHAAAQSAFTKSYLDERGRADLWDALEPYNQAIARSSTLGQTSETPAGWAHLAFTNSMRMQLFDQWHKQGFEPKAVARAANRLSTDVAWEKGLTAGFLMLSLCERLGCEVNEEAQFRLIAVIRGLYDGVREALKPIKVEA